MATIGKDIVDQDDGCDTQEIDKGIKNSWFRDWLEKTSGWYLCSKHYQKG